MNIVKVGDHEKAACFKCKSFQVLTFKLRDTPFSDGSGTVKNVLVGVCDRCDSVIVVPHQSTPAIKKQLTKQRTSVEIRVPAHMIDILNLVSDALGGGPESVPSIMKVYIHLLSTEVLAPGDIGHYLKSDLARGESQKRISLKGHRLAENCLRLKEITEISSNTDLLKSVVLKLNDDILVYKKKTPIEHLRILAATA